MTFHNDINMILLSIAAKYCNVHTRIAVIRTRHGPHKFLLRAIASVNDVAGRLVKTNILYVGATIKHCFLFIRVRI
jgi:ribonuclease P/MRP protein subunit POP5